MSPVVHGRFVPGPHALDRIPPSPDPLEALSGLLLPLKWAIKAAGVVFVSALGLLVFACFAVIFAFLLRAGIPIFMDGMPVMGDQRDALVEIGDSMPPFIPVAGVVVVVSAGVMRLLIMVAARYVRDPKDAMVTAFYRRIERDLARSFGGQTTIRDRVQIVVLAAAAIAGFIVTWIWMNSRWNQDPAPDGFDWVMRILLIGTVFGIELLVAWGVWTFAGYSIPYFVGPLGIESSEVDALGVAGEERREALALQRRPEVGTPLRLDAAITVFVGDFPPRPEDSDRALFVPWTGKTTGVEILAGALLAVAVSECRERGLLECEGVGDQTRFNARLPDGVRPEGLARIMLGHRPYGLDSGRHVSGSLGTVLASWMRGGDEDPHWVVIEIALDDLRKARLMVQDRLDVAALRVAAQGPTSNQGRDTEAMANLSAAWAKALGKLRTVDAAPGLFAIASLATNSQERGGRRLPEALDSNDPIMPPARSDGAGD